MQNIGWQGWKNDSDTAGTTGQALRVEALQIKSNISGLGIRYCSHVQNIGWQDWVSDGETSGTTGQALRVEAVKIELTDVQASNYDVYYRVHVQDVGWLGWAENGEMAGTSGYSKRVEAIEIKLVAKGSAFNKGATASYAPVVTYQTHVQNYGWMSSCTNGATSGTTGQALRIEAIKIQAANSNSSIALSYNSHLANVGWQGWKNSGELSGTTGEARQMEAIQIKLTGTDADNYNVYYRVHSQNFGWLGWTSNGEIAGTTGYGYRMEAIQIEVLPKFIAGPSLSNSYFNAQYTIPKGATGVDVSYWNGYHNNWSTAKSAGVQFAILRTSYGYPGSGGKDSSFEGNYSNATAAGIPVGVYHFSEAMTTDQARAEAQYVLSILGGRHLDLPVAYDVEASNEAALDQLSKTQLTDNIVTFCETIKAGGYTPMVYANLNWLRNKIDYSRISGYKIWLAQYNDSPTYENHFDIWQYSSKGIINGLSINSNNGNAYVDMNLTYSGF